MTYLLFTKQQGKKKSKVDLHQKQFVRKKMKIQVLREFKTQVQFQVNKNDDDRLIIN